MPKLNVTREEALRAIDERIAIGRGLQERTFSADGDEKNLQHDGERWHAFNVDLLRKLVDDSAVAEELGRFMPGSFNSHDGPGQWWETWQRIVTRKLNVLASVRERLELFDQAEPDEEAEAVSDPSKVFVVLGRDSRVNEAMFTFLQALGLQPMEWNHLIRATKKGAPYVGEVVEKGFSEAQAVIVLMTPDDMVQLRPDLLNDHDEPDERSVMAQPRPNVIFEAGMAFGAHPDRTILVTFARTRKISDVIGRHEVRFDGGPIARQDLAERLENANCAVNKSGSRWLTAGTFPTFDWNDPLGGNRPTAAAEATAENESVALVLGAMALHQEEGVVMDDALREATGLSRDQFDFATEEIEQRGLARIYRVGGMRIRFEPTKETRRWWAEHPEHTAVDSVEVESAAWMPKHKSFVLRFRNGAALEVTTDPTFGDLVWLGIRGHDVGVKAEGMPVSDAHRYLALMEDVWDALERGGEHSVTGERFRYSPPIRVSG